MPAATNQGRTQAPSGPEPTEKGRASAVSTPICRTPGPLSVFRQMVKAECEATPDIDVAKSRVMAKLAADPELREALRDHAERTLVSETVYELRHIRRAEIKQQHRPCTYTFEAMAQTAETVAKSILDSWTLSTGNYLGDATGAELKVEAERERQQAHGHTLNARLYERLAELAGDDGTVRETVKDADAVWGEIKGK